MDIQPRRLADGDTVPVPGYRRYADILNEPTRPLRPVDPASIVRPYVNHAEQEAAKRRRWRRA